MPPPGNGRLRRQAGDRTEAHHPRAVDSNPMPLPYLIRRLAQTVVLLLVVSLVVFALVTQAPGGPGILLDRNMGAAEIAQMRVILGLDQPLHVQYARWLAQVLRGNLGISYQAGLPVLEI